jgi:hypothetical protein
LAFSNTSFPYGAVVHIHASFGGLSNTKFVESSGVLIAPDEVLTTTHAISQSGLGTATKVEVAPGQTTTLFTFAEPFGSAQADALHFNTLTNVGGVVGTADEQNDFAIIHLATPIGLETGTMGIDPNFTGGTVHVTGYPLATDLFTGAQETDDPSVALTRDASFNLWHFDPRTTNAGTTTTTITHASEGGPLWYLDSTGRPFVVGIVAAGQSTPGPLSEDAAALTPADVAQIQAWEAIDHPAPTGSAAAPPTISAPAAVTVKVGQLLTIRGISIADSDATALNQSITVAVTATSGTFGDVSTDGSATLSPVIHTALIRGTLTQVNNDLASIGLAVLASDQPAGTITITATDGISTSSKQFSFSSLPSHPITPDVSASGVNPLEAALVDTIYYLANNPDVARTGMDPAVHFAQFGWKEGRNPDALFDVSYYLAHNPDVAASGIDPLLHYATFGWKEGRDPSATFSTSIYLLHNPDVARAGIDPLQQYLLYGVAEGRGL